MKEGEVQVLEEEEQQQEWTEGARNLVGGGAMRERLVGTMAILETPSSIREVQGALIHAHRVALGLSLPARAILICPLSSLPDPPPAPSAEATPAFSRVSRRPLQGAAGSLGYPLASNLPGAPAGPKGLPQAPGRELGLKQLPRPQLQLLPQGEAGSPQYCHRGTSLALSQLESLLTLGSSLSSIRRVATGGTRGSTPMQRGPPPRWSSGRPTA